MWGEVQKQLAGGIV